MFTKLHLVKDGFSEVVIKLHELIWLADQIVNEKMTNLEEVKPNTLPEKKASYEKAIEQYQSYLQDIDDPDESEVSRLQIAFQQASSVYRKEQRLQMESQEKSLIPNYHISQDKLKQLMHSIRGRIIKAYAGYYQLSELSLNQYLNYLADPFSMLNPDPMIMKDIKAVEQTLKQKQAPDMSFANPDELLSIIFPDHIKSPQRLDDWMMLATYFREQHKHIPVNGWWLLVAGRVLSVRNKVDKQKFLYINDHGSQDAIKDNVRWCLENFSFDEGYIHLIQRLDTFWNQLNSESLPLIENMFISSFYEIHREISYKKMEELLFETFEDLSSLLMSPEHLKLVEQKLIEDEKSMPPELKRQAQDVFANTMQRFSYMVLMSKSYFRTQFNVSGKYPLYSHLAACMHLQDSNLLIVLDMIEKQQLDLNKGIMEPLLRPSDAYGDKYNGDSYTEFARSLLRCQQDHPLWSDSKIVKCVRKILAGSPNIKDLPDFLPNLVAVMFGSETARIPRLFLSSMMLLDLIENGHSLDENQADYSWLNALVSPARIDGENILTHQESDEQNMRLTNLHNQQVELKKFDGLYPQAHYESAKDTTYKDGQLSATRQKEGMIIIQWLCLVLKDSFKKQGITVFASQEPLPIGIQKTNSIKSIYSNYIKNQASAAIGSKNWTRSAALNKIIPIMKSRLTNLLNVHNTSKPAVTGQAGFFQNDTNGTENKSKLDPSSTKADFNICNVPHKFT